MRILVDTPVWSQALRRKRSADSPAAALLKSYIVNGEYLCLTGLILQEILSGIASETFFKRLEDHLAAFPLLDVEREDHVNAARLRKVCKKKGLPVGTIDALIAAVCIKHDLLLLSTDKYFQAIAGVSKLKLIDVAPDTQ